jgi:hypothetical protein
MTEKTPDVSELRQWSLLRRLHEGGGGKLGLFLKEHDYPWEAALKPWGKYYAHIRNKNIRVMALTFEERIEFIDKQIALCGNIRDKETAIELHDTKQLPSVKCLKLIDILGGLDLNGKNKLINVMKDLRSEEKATLIDLLASV